jgi:hypothetical protein
MIGHELIVRAKPDASERRREGGPERENTLDCIQTQLRMLCVMRASHPDPLWT